MFGAVATHAEMATVRNGIKLFYEIKGEGQPVVLLHGGTATIQLSFSKQIDLLATHHRVVMIEQMGHGHTPDVEGRPFSYEEMTEDTAAVLKFPQSASVTPTSIGVERWWADRAALGRISSGLGPSRCGVGSRIRLESGIAPIGREYVGRPLAARVSRCLREHLAGWRGALAGRVAQSLQNVGGCDLGIHRGRSAPHPGAGVDHRGRTRHRERRKRRQRVARAIPGAIARILPGADHFTFQKRADLMNPLLLEFLDAK